ncbi:hypothetical protein LOK49_LG04G01875 [Camellia lanceoleosa]|uniref:Uncharacterized protein n=1 Tax=Camellia lanceoleosa TaxID=1840588 RepID=A0ACC0I0Y4_9ERIC|nr:hypothetical protein LOK49_LG04G01875 [Camellia lanceoleosa]
MLPVCAQFAALTVASTSYAQIVKSNQKARCGVGAKLADGDVSEMWTECKLKDLGLWNTMITGVAANGHYVSLAEDIAMQLFEHEPNNPGNYVMPPNIYTNAGGC